MKAIDTNVAVRLLIEDDKAQAAVARKLLDRGVLLVPTVLLETAWVLMSRYRFSTAESAELLTRLLELPGVHVADPAGTAWSIKRAAAGADFADMTHIAAARGADSFATFDRAVARHAGASPPLPLETLS